MAFTISELNLGVPATRWFPIDNTDTIYVGQLVCMNSAPTTFEEGIIPLGAADGEADTDDNSLVLGVVVGTNRRYPDFDATFKANKIVDVVTPADQRSVEKVGGHGSHMIAGDQLCYAEVAMIDSTTVLEGPVYASAYGTAPNEVTVTGASADGGVTAATVGTLGYTPVTAMCTAYCRSGTNAGAYRVTTGTTATEVQVVHGYPNEVIAVGDTFVGIGMKLGLSFMQLDAESMYIEHTASPATNFYVVKVMDINLAEAGRERVHFAFTGDHFSLYRT